MTGKRILVVDDEPLIRESLKMLLSYNGHAIETAREAREALRKLETADFDLVFTDLRMPGMSGDELAREIKSKKPQQRIVLLTAYPPEPLPSHFHRVPVKPFSVAQLHKIVNELD